MRLAVVGKDASEAEKLTDGIRKSAEDIEIYRYKSGDEFIGVWEKDKFDIVILDIPIGDKNGMDIARAVRQSDKDVRIVLASHSGEFAGESYDVDASYYLRKPYCEEQINIMLERLELDRYRSRLITLPQGEEIKLSNILYAKNCGQTVRFHLKGNAVREAQIGFDKVNGLLGGKFGFCSLSDNITVNFAGVASCKDDIIAFTDKTTLAVPKRRAKEISAAYTAYCFERLRKDGSGL